MKILKLTLIVPSNSSHESLNFFFENMLTWTSLPKEIILINTNNSKKLKIDNFYGNFLNKKKILIKFLHHPKFYPGAARNIGITLASHKIISFLDVGTHASKDWLENGYNQLKKSKNLISWGNTYYLAASTKDEIIRASTYGAKPLTTLPGSTVNKKVFNTVGVFVENIRAGEDAEWRHRVDLHNVKTCVNNKIILYQNLLGVSYFEILKKWFRNYSFSRKLSYLNNNRETYFISISLILIILAFNWNPLFTNWGKPGFEDEITYIPHITKVTILSLMFFYFTVRAIYLPIKKGIEISFLLKFNIIKILLLSFCIDITKLVSFFYSRFK